MRRVPAKQEMHVVEKVAEVAAEYVPAGQTAQSARVSWLPAFTPLSLLNVPAGQLVHVTAPDDRASLPRAQGKQEVKPVELANVPAGQGTQLARPVAFA